MGVSSAAAIERYDSCCVSDACRRLLLTLLSPTLPTTHTRAFNGLFSMTIRVSRYQTGKTSLDFTEARDSEWQWHQLGHMQICTLLQTDNRASTPPLSFLQAECFSCRPTNSVKALKATHYPRRPTRYIISVNRHRAKRRGDLCPLKEIPPGYFRFDASKRRPTVPASQQYIVVVATAGCWRDNRVRPTRHGRSRMDGHIDGL